MHKVGSQIIVSIENLSLHGGGVARTPQGVVFVRQSAPGDELKVEITEVKKNYSLAKIIEIINSSPDRVTPLCPQNDQCGGCSWQHLSYSAQLKYKQKLFEEAFDHTFKSKNKSDRPIINPIARSKDEFGYRNRIRVKKNKNQVGYFSAKSHDFVPIDSCLVAQETINQGLDFLRNKSEGTPENIKYLPKSKTNRDSHVNPLNHIQTFEVSLDSKYKVIYSEVGKDELSFTQVNPYINEKIKSQIAPWAMRSGATHFIDLYCGSGNLTFPLVTALPQAQGVGVEANKRSIEKANEIARLVFENSQDNKTQLKFICQSSEAFIKAQFESKSNQPLKINKEDRVLVVVDPPRSGLDPDLLKILSRQKNIVSLIYMSCDPMTFLRDAKRLEDFGFNCRLSEIELFDMFPQTDHLELVALFEAKNLVKS